MLQSYSLPLVVLTLSNEVFIGLSNVSFVTNAWEGAHAREHLPEGQHFGVSVDFVQHSFHQLLVFLRVHGTGAVNHSLNLLDCETK